MNTTPWLSVLLPVYNVEQYLEECLASVLHQADEGIEIIVLDDCSTDNSLATLENIVKNASAPIRILQHEKNSGLSAARNTMLDAASGEYIWFLDSDDVMETGAIAQLKQIVTAHSPDLVMCDFRVLRQHQKLKHKLRGENHRPSFVGAGNVLLQDPAQLFYGLYKKGELHIWSKITKRALWNDDLRFPVGRYMEDMMLTPRLLLRVQSYFYQPNVWVAYRQREGSILSTPSEKKIYDAAEGSYGVLKEWLQRYPNLSETARLAFSHYCARTHYVVMRDLKQWNPECFHEKKEVFRKKLIENIHWSPSELSWQYIKRGLITRFLRFISKY